MAADWTWSRALVFAVVVTALAAFLSMTYLLFARKGSSGARAVRNRVREDVASGAIIRIGWVGLVLDAVWGPAYYNHIPPAGWVILAAQVYQTVALVRLCRLLLTPEA